LIIFNGRGGGQENQNKFVAHKKNLANSDCAFKRDIGKAEKDVNIKGGLI
jgi:hypothetical protein